MALRSNQNADILDGFSYDGVEFSELPDKRTKAVVTVGGKRFEAFGDDERWANIALEQRVREAVQNGEVTLNEDHFREDL